MNNYFVDTHAHICSQYEKKELKQIFEEAWKDNLKYIINVGTDLNTSKQVINVAKNNNGIFSAVGIHPVDCKNEQDLERISELISTSNKVIAIGEIGLDYFHLKNKNAPEKTIQKKFFEKQLQIALRNNLPVLIHCREALDDLMIILKKPEYKSLTGIMHTFAGNIQEAQELIKLGFYISFSGVITFKNAPLTREVAKNIPINRIFTETDTPFLTPEPFRGKRNHTRNVVLVARKIAEIRKISLEKLTSQIIKNFNFLFKI